MDDVKIVQLSVFMENKPGRLNEICQTLSDIQVNIRGFSVADMVDYGIFRLIVGDHKKAKDALSGKGFTVNESHVLCLDVPDRPGGLADILEMFTENNVSVEYMYVIAYTKIAFSFEDLDSVIPLIKENKIPMLTRNDISAL